MANIQLKTRKASYKNSLLILSIFLYISCGESNEYISIKNPTDFTDNSFISEQKIHHTIFNEDFIGNPVRLTYIDSLLFAIDSKTDTIAHVFSINNKKNICNIIPRGIGPCELLSIGTIRQGDSTNTFWAYDISRKLWQKGSLNSSTLKYEMNQSFHFSDTTFAPYIIEDPVWISNQLFVCTSLINYKERYFIFNKDNKLIKSGHNPYLVFNNEIPNGILSELSSTLLDLKPDKTKLVLASRYLNYIEIYNLIDNTIDHHLRGPKKSSLVFDESRSFNLNTMIKTNKTSKSFLCVRCSNEKIYVLYSGKERNDPSGYTNSNIIYSFTWDGTPLTRYRLDTDITSFDIDEAHARIYAIKYPDNSIISFELK